MQKLAKKQDGKKEIVKLVNELEKNLTKKTLIIKN